MKKPIILLASIVATIGYISAQEESIDPVYNGGMAPDAEAVVPSTSDETPVAVTPSEARATVVEDDKGEGATASEAGGDTLSVDFPNEEIRTILRNVADLFELNLVIPDSLQGRTSLKLREVTWRQIFQVVLSQVGYAFIEDGNIIRIISLDEVELAPMVTQTIRLERVSAGQVEPNLRALLSQGVRGASGDDNRAGGAIVVNKISNELIVTERPDRLAKIMELARNLDSSPKQIVIEAKFVEINMDDGQNRELKAAYNGSNFDVSTGAGNFAPGTGNVPAPFNLGAISNQLTGGFPSVVYNSSEFSVLANFINSTGRARLVSNPTVVALNGQSSKISVGRDVQLVSITQQITPAGQPGQTTASADKTIFIGIDMQVSAQITGSDLVELTVKPVKTSIGRERRIAGNTFYDVDKREGDLKIMLRSGRVAAIGGFIDEVTRSDIDKVPLLGDVPVLGRLFQRTIRTKSTTNLVIFISAAVLDADKTDSDNTINSGQLNALNLKAAEIEYDNRGVGKNYFKKSE